MNRGMLKWFYLVVQFVMLLVSVPKVGALFHAYDTETIGPTFLGLDTRSWLVGIAIDLTAALTSWAAMTKFESSRRRVDLLPAGVIIAVCTALSILANYEDAAQHAPQQYAHVDIFGVSALLINPILVASPPAIVWLLTVLVPSILASARIKTAQEINAEVEEREALIDAEARVKAAKARANANVREAQLTGLAHTARVAKERAIDAWKGPQSTADDDPHDDGPGGGLTPQSNSDDLSQSYGELVRIAPRNPSAVNNRSSGGPARQSTVRQPLHRRVAQSGVITVADLVEALHIGEAQARTYLSPIASPPRDGQRRAPRIEAPVDDVLATLRAGKSPAMRLHAQTLDAALHPQRSRRRDRQSSMGQSSGRVASQTPVDRAGWRVLNPRSGAGADPQSGEDGVPQSDGELVNA